MNNLTDQIEQFLSKYDFETLSASQQSQVIAELGEDTYRQMRSVVSGSIALSDSAPPLSADLKAQIKSSSQVQQTTSSTMNLKQFAIGLFIGAVSTTLLLQFFNTTHEQPNEIKQAIHTDTIYVHTIDTIYQSIPSEPTIITKEIIKYLETPKDSVVTATSYAFADDSTNSSQHRIVSTIQQSLDSIVTIAIQTPIKKGRTVGDEEELMNLLSGVRAFGIDE